MSSHKRSYHEASRGQNQHHYDRNNNNNNYNKNTTTNSHQHSEYDGPPSSKRQRVDQGHDRETSSKMQLRPNASMTSLAAPSNDQQLIAAHYGNRVDGGLGNREQSSIIQLRKLNNWTKSVLIDMFCRQKSSVLDIGGGKGGDLNKWNFRRIEELVHCDHAIGSIMDCKERYNEGLSKNRFQFGLKLICADAFRRSIMDSLDNDLYFDIVSSQFALHYAFETEQRVRAMLLNVTQRLRENGYFIGTVPDGNVLVQKWRSKSPKVHCFGNSKYRVTFKCHSEEMEHRKKLSSDNPPFAIRYLFELNDAVDCPEYLLHFDNFKKLAAEDPYNLEIVLEANFHEFFARNCDHNDYRKLLQKIGITDMGGNGSIYNDQWEIAYLYKVFAFRKKRTSGRKYPVRPKRECQEITDQDIVVCE